MPIEENKEAQNQEKQNRGFQAKQNPRNRQRARQESQELAPPVFHAHALDLDPDLVIPERPSVDLTYTDFTRSAIEGELKQPKMRKRKPLIPFELTETPRLNADQWEGRPPGRRKLMAAAEEGTEEEKTGEAGRPQEGRKNRERPETRQEKRGEVRQEGERQSLRQEQRPAEAKGENRDNSRKNKNSNQWKKAGGPAGAKPQIPEGRLPRQSAEAVGAKGEGEAKKGKSFWAKRREEAKRQKEQASSSGNHQNRQAPASESLAESSESNKPRRENRRSGSGAFRAQGRQNERPKEQRQGGRSRQEREEAPGENQSLIKPYWLKK